jgi:MoCo/4Fe-4S cofactor protein with predicted Tat translocation signal
MSKNSSENGMSASGNKAGNAVDHETKNAATPMTLAEVRQQLKGVKGKRFWRSVDELADTPEFQAAVEREFPSSAQEWVDPVSRRGFLKVMGASMALAGLAGCTKQPEETIYPYVKQPEDLILGKPMYFATAHPFTTGGVPLLVKSDEFRPIKAIRSTPTTWAHPTLTRKERCWSCTILTARTMRPIAANSGSGRSLLKRFARSWPLRRTEPAFTF